MKQRLFIILCFCTSITAQAVESLSKTTVMVPMRDGIQLATDVYRILDNRQRPVLLYRTPYDKNYDKLDDVNISFLQLMGYTYVTQDTRGRYSSQGADSLFYNDGWGALQDGYDTIDWLSKQKWCNGKIAQFGASASGITTYRSLGAAHPNLLCTVAIVAASDFYHQVIYPGGELQKTRVEEWITGQQSAYMLPVMLAMPYYNDFWRQYNLHERSAQITASVLHIGGWYDCFSEGTIAAFTDLARRSTAGSQKLIMGPWVHTGMGTSHAGEMSYPGAEIDLISPAIAWFERWLKNVPAAPADKAAVTYYLMGDPDKPGEGGCRWIDADEWPPQTSDFVLIPDGNHALLPSYAGPDTSLTWRFDANNPVPTIGGNNHASKSISDGPRDQRVLNQRTDIVSFATAVLDQPMRVEGTVSASLLVSSDRPDSDFTLKLIDVYPDGREMIVGDGIRRMRFRNGYSAADEQLINPGDTVRVRVDLPPTALVFSTGHRIKISISSSNYPRYEINPNTGAAPNDRSNPLIASNKILLGIQASRLVLPLVNRIDQVAQKDAPLQPDRFHLVQNFPNPFNASTRIRYYVSEPGKIALSIYNIQGKMLRQWSESCSSGVHEWVWDGRDEARQSQPSGTYFCVMQSPGGRKAIKLNLIR